MEIEFLEKSFLPFADLKIGDVFCRKGCAYMKTNSPNVLSKVVIQNSLSLMIWSKSSMMRKYV